MRSFVSVAVLAALLFTGGLVSNAAAAQSPTEVVQTGVDEILSVLRASKGGLSGQDKEKIFGVVENIFDLKLFSRRTLGRNWNVLSEEQQTEFVDLYSQLLKNTYIERVEAYSDEKVTIDDELDMGKGKAEVRTTVTGAGTDIPIFYRLYDRGEGWKVYDVLVEGVSLVSNYRSQFSDILAKGSPEKLLAMLRNKVS